MQPNFDIIDTIQKFKMCLNLTKNNVYICTCMCEYTHSFNESIEHIVVID